MRFLVLALLLVAGCTHDHSSEKVDARPYIVELREDVDVDGFLDEHYLEPTQLLPAIHGFAADLRPATVDVLSTDERVSRLHEDHSVFVPFEHHHE